MNNNESKYKCIESLLAQKVPVLITRNAALLIIDLLNKMVENNSDSRLQNDPFASTNIRIGSELIKEFEKAIM